MSAVLTHENESRDRYFGLYAARNWVEGAAEGVVFMIMGR
jgi:hypothetical protein